MLSYKNIIHILPGKELNYILHDMVRKTHLRNQCLYRDLKCSQYPNMASSSLFLICFFRNTTPLSFHVANADDYHCRVNTQGSWDSPQQLTAPTCTRGREELASSSIQLFCPRSAEGFLSKCVNTKYVHYPNYDNQLAAELCCGPFKPTGLRHVFSNKEGGKRMNKW